jgi:hypothetical protein
VVPQPGLMNMSDAESRRYPTEIANCKMNIANFKMICAGNCEQFAICILQFSICNLDFCLGCDRSSNSPKLLRRDVFHQASRSLGLTGNGWRIA